MAFLQTSLKLFITYLVLAMILSCAVFDKNQSESPAERFLKHQIDKYPTDATTHYQLGLFYYSGSRYQLASTQLKKAIEIKPDYAEAYLTLGSSLEHLGEYDASIDSFQKAIDYKVTYWAEAYNLIGAAYRDRYYIGNDRSRESIELSLNNFLKASERCDDVNNSLCLSIIQNIVVSYMDLYGMSGNGDKKNKSYLGKAIESAKRALTPANRQQNKYQYGMLQYSSGEAYMLLPEADNNRKAETAFNEALSVLDINAYPSEYKMVKNSLELLKQEKVSDNLTDNTAISSEASHRPLLTVQFLNDAGKALHDAAATLIESKGDEFIKAHFREKPIDKDGSISLSSTFLDLPDGSYLFVCTRDEYYCHSFAITDLKKIKTSGNKLMLAVPKTGVISASIVTNKKGAVEPIVVSVLKLNMNGMYSHFSDIGIWLSNNYPFSISGLPTGTYMIKVKKNYEDSTVYYQKDGIKVVAGNKTDLGGLELKVK